MKLREYQEQGADFLYEHDRAMILAPVGAGKTAMTLTAMQDLGGRFLVLAPLRVCKTVWPVEQPKWAPKLRLAVAVGTPAQRAAALASDADVVVTNYDNLQWLATQPLKFDAIVFDELTRLKNPSGARFKALHKVIDKIKIRWGLTGSFTSNGLEDVFGQCKIVDQSLLGRSKGAFLQQYFSLINPDYGEWAARPGALEAVMQRIKTATFVLEPGEYADKLPPCYMVEMRCDMDDRTPYEQMKKDSIAKLEKDITALTAAVAINKLQQIASGFVYDENGEAHWTGSHKFDLLDEILTENQGANTIVVYNYKEELAELQRRYPNAKTIDGNVEAWNDGKIPLLLIHPKSAGHGLNLQHGGNKIIFMSLPWSLELFEQTVGRLHRSGQKHDVWCYVLMTNKTVDERIWASLHDKKTISDIALNELKQ
ncbi:MAG: DEAD/DEAH box helicase [Beijerinckiaceae bacterium]|nr:DEAD/DEAH box helicase [Beijerinckiaceae bacterium]